MKHTITSPDKTPIGRFAFGTMQFGGTADVAASRAMFGACIDAGITHFDTAHLYTDGASETLLGTMIADHRDRLVIATKAAFLGGSNAKNIRTSLETSRQRLDLDAVDILYLHRFDPDTDMHETFEAIAQAKADGHIRYVGVSNFAAWQVMKAMRIAAKFDLRIDIMQPMYSLVKRQAEVEILPMCADQDIAVAPYSPLGGGLLTGKYDNNQSGRLTEDNCYAARYGVNWMHNAATLLKQIAADIDVHPATLAVAWVAAHWSGPMPILSARNADQLKPSLAAMTYDMPPELYTRLAALPPTPPPPTDRIEEQS